MRLRRLLGILFVTPLFIPALVSPQELIWQRIERGIPGGARFDSEGNILALSNAVGQVIKFDPNGEIIWRSITDVGDDGTLCVDGQDNIYTTSLYAGAYKLNPDGELLWSVDLTSLCFELYGLDSDNTGNVYVTGKDAGMFLAKLDSEGEILWSREEAGWGSGWSCAVDPWGDVIVSGQVQLGSEPYDWLIVKYSSTGEKLWERIDGTPGDDYGGGVCVDDEGFAYVVGDWMAKYDKDGNLIWTDEELSGGAPLFDGESSIYFRTNPYNEPSQLVRCDLDGNMIWMYPVLGSMDRYIGNMSGLEQQYLAISGGIRFGNWIITTKFLVGPNHVDLPTILSSKALRVFPNPARNTLTIEWSGHYTEPGPLAIYDLQGRKIRQAGLEDRRFVWDCRDQNGSRFPPGTYVLRLTQENAECHTTLFVVAE